jgi:hypothetical protein
MKKKTNILIALAVVAMLLSPIAGVFAADDSTSAQGSVSGDASGNDPRDFGTKFMPYYRYTELENGVEVNELTLFGFFAFNTRFGLTYELPVAKEIDYSELEPDGNVTGMGDLGLRFFLRPKQWEFAYMDDKKNFSLIPLVEFTLPTATDDLLGGETLVVSPGFVLVFDLPFDKPPLGLAFIAMMNFYDFDAFKDNDRPDVSRYRGRWFYQQPLSKPAFVNNPNDKSFHIFDLSGLYLMPELQPVYDFEEDEFSLWVSPEIGKVLREGTIIYAKPGWGVDNNEDGDREFTFEIGFRYFL